MGKPDHIELVRHSEINEALAARLWYQKMIDYIKDTVGEGAEYANDLVRVVLSERGCYYQFRDLPEEFSGVLGDGFSHEFMGSRQALQLFEAVHDLVRLHDLRTTRELSLLAFYDQPIGGGLETAYQYYYQAEPGEESIASTDGSYRPGVLPVFFKLKVQSTQAVPVLGASCGALFFVAYLTDRHLLVRIPQVTGLAANLGQMSGSLIVH